MAILDQEVILCQWSLGSFEPMPTGITRLNLHFLTSALDFRVLSVRCRSNKHIMSWLDTLWELAGYRPEDLESNWDLLKGHIFYLRIRDCDTVTGVLSHDRKNILKIKAEYRY